MSMKANKLTAGHNLMWESSRMILPEHKEQLLKERRNQELFHMPQLTEEQLQEMDLIIQAAIKQNCSITITYTEKYGPAQFSGKIKKINSQEASLKVSNRHMVLTLPFHKILQIEKMEGAL